MGRKDKPVSPAQARTHSLGMRLRYARQDKGISISELAKKLNYTTSYLSGVENDSTRASSRLIRLYEQALGLPVGELGELKPWAQSAVEPVPSEPRLWNVPYRRNLFFTGREHFLQTIHARLMDKQVIPHVLAISGLGGIGKTQLVVEYAYSQRENYRAIFWIDADSPETLALNFARLHLLLGSEEINDQVQATLHVQRWLQTHSNCLLVFDNVDDLSALDGYLPQLGENYILFTTRLQAIGMIAQKLELESMSEDEGVVLLLRRAKLIAPRAQPQELSPALLAPAREISRLMGGLPLALNSAASYIEQTGCTLLSYIDLLRTQQAKTLRESGPLASERDYQASVATTWSISFAAIARSNAAATELLYLCAFLRPDSIYQDMIVQGASVLGPALQHAASDTFVLARTFGELRKYSFLTTSADRRAFSMHRLVQAVVRDSLSTEAQQQWAMCVVHMVSQAFPRLDVSRIEPLSWQELWGRCQRYFPQIELCQQLIDQWKLLDASVVQLLGNVGRYLEERKDIPYAAQFYRRALDLGERLYGLEHRALIADLGRLARVYELLGKIGQAEGLYERILFILDQVEELNTLDPFLLKSYIRLLRKMKREEEAQTLRQKTVDVLQARTEPRLLQRIPVNDDDARIRYSDNWCAEKRQGSGDYNSDVHWTDRPGASAEFEFNGVGIEIISDTSSCHGELDISLDDLPAVPLDTVLIENRFTQTIIFHQTSLEAGEHKLRIVLRSGIFVLDALAIFAYQDDEDLAQR